MVGFLKLTEKHIKSSKSSQENFFNDKNLKNLEFLSTTDSEEITEEKEEQGNTVIEKSMRNLARKSDEFDMLNKELTSLNEASLEATKELISFAITITNDTKDEKDTIETYSKLQNKLIDLREKINITDNKMNSVQEEKEQFEKELNEYITILENDKESLENSPERDEDAIQDLKTTINELNEEKLSIKNNSNDINNEEKSKRENILSKIEEIKNENDAILDKDFNITITFDDGSIQKISTFADENGNKKINLG